MYDIVFMPGFLSTLSLRRATAFAGYFRSSPLISIHALLAESDVEKVPADVFYQAFLSTLSLRRATANAVDQILPGHISIHALLAESDPIEVPQYQIFDISIHALLAESDSPPSVTPAARRNFYPRSPCGERR